jgi:hypothetical protein
MNKKKTKNTYKIIQYKNNKVLDKNIQNDEKEKENGDKMEKKRTRKKTKS